MCVLPNQVPESVKCECAAAIRQVAEQYEQKLNEVKKILLPNIEAVDHQVLCPAYFQIILEAQEVERLREVLK